MQNPGLSREIQEAIKRRQAGASVAASQQVSPQAATIHELPQPAIESEMTKASVPKQTAPVQKFQPTNAHEAIVAALIEQLKNDNKLDKEKMKMATQPMPEPAQASVAPPSQPTQTQAPQTPSMGGGGFSLSPGIQQPMARNQMQGNYSGLNNFGRGI